MSKKQIFVVCCVFSALSFQVGFVASYHYYRRHPVKMSSGTQQRFAKTYTLDLSDPMPFGKHKGKTVQEVIETSPDYISWMRREVQRVTFTPEAIALHETK
ncbi:MAG: hypothetical protein GY801_02360 [bacterium]|nr:hypothetical protein [bacterium]